MTASLLAFAIVALIGIATPGPTVLLAFSNGSRFGVKRALPGMAGAILSDFVLIGAVGLGLGALLAASEFWFAILKWLGVGYLAFLGVTLLRSKGSLSDAARSAAHDVPGAKLFWKSFLVAVTNPKGYLFFSAFLPQFVDPNFSQPGQYLTLAIVFSMLDLIVMLAYAMLGSRASRLLTGRAARWLDRVCGSALLLLAGTLALQRRVAS